MKQAKDLDQLIEVQNKFVSSILDKALLSPKHEDLYRHLQKMLNFVYTFTYIQEQHLYKSALDEYQRIKQKEEGLGGDFSVDMGDGGDQTEVSLQACTQLNKIHDDFVKTYFQFKKMLDEQK